MIGRGNISEILEGWYLEERRVRALRLLLDRGAMDAPAWVWDVVDSWDMAR